MSPIRCRPTRYRSLSGEAKVSILRAEAEEAGAEIDVAGVGGDEVDGVDGVEVAAAAEESVPYHFSGGYFAQKSLIVCRWAISRAW